MSTPETWEGRNLALELESFDEEDEDKPNKPFMADLRAFTYSDIVKVGDAEKEASENAQEKPKPRPRVTFKDVPSAPEKKVKPVNPAISAEIERLRRKFSEES
ncbi:hypothetical protein QTG54_011846 [Skeletonema marinoi]|uniref:Uncharacterized protein n=1 Tax=Skeletonema marinoi TaxID=267567 RepID=A0AAD8Y1Z0_9STRA|nr:hypothetical protein QTG54_011846 [Skeletonema marinoi]